jgi:hypothetical protein
MASPSCGVPVDALPQYNPILFLLYFFQRKDDAFPQGSWGIDSVNPTGNHKVMTLQQRWIVEFTRAHARDPATHLMCSHGLKSRPRVRLTKYYFHRLQSGGRSRPGFPSRLYSAQTVTISSEYRRGYIAHGGATFSVITSPQAVGNLFS